MCELSPESLLYRRISEHFLTKDNGVSSAAFETYRVSSSGFTNEELSVDRADLLDGPRACIKNYPDDGVVSLQASIAIKEKLEVRADALPENPAHALIKGKKSKRVSRALAHACNWEHPTKGFEIHTPKFLRKIASD